MCSTIMFEYEINKKLRGVERGRGGSREVKGDCRGSRGTAEGRGGFRSTSQGFSQMGSTILDPYVIEAAPGYCGPPGHCSSVFQQVVVPTKATITQLSLICG